MKELVMNELCCYVAAEVVIVSSAKYHFYLAEDWGWYPSHQRLTCLAAALKVRFAGSV